MKPQITLHALLLGLAVLLPSFGASAVEYEEDASRVVTGRVIDKNGHAISNALITINGLTYFEHTADDGSFTIEVPFWVEFINVSSDGFNNKTVKLKRNAPTIITMGIKKKIHGFVSVVGGAVWPVANKPAEAITGGGIPQFGLMGGAYRTWGGYLKIVAGTPFGDHVPTGVARWTRKYDSTPTITAGAIRKLTDDINIFIGTGLAVNYTSSSTTSQLAHLSATNSIISIEPIKYITGSVKQEWTLPIEAGAMWKISSRINLLAGIIYCLPPFNSSESVTYVQKPTMPADGTYTVETFKSCASKNSGNLGAYLGIGINF